MEVHPAIRPITLKRTLRASVGALLLAPFVLILLASGVVFLWENPWLLRWLWIPIPICWFIALLLFRMAKRRYGPIWRPSTEILPHWTDQDREAWRQVTVFADTSQPESIDQFFNADLYLETTQQLAEQLAVHYHPNAKDAIDNLTIPEILTAAELAISDLRRFVEQNVPGSHLMTVRWLRRAPQVTNAWQQIRPLYFVASAFWRPWAILSRTAADGAVVNPVMEEVKKEGMAGLYRVFVLQLGKYLIELNSHRLKVGPDRWRELMQPESQGNDRAGETAGDRAEPAKANRRAARRGKAAQGESSEDLRIALVGQVKAGKSSLVNALIGQQEAAVDILPLTDTIRQYSLHPERVNAQLTLLDTVGYAHEGLKSDRVDETMRAVCESAMAVLVMNACNPAREPDSALLRTMESWFQQHPQRRRPPILVVLTHIDQLAPSLEWSPPYDGWVRAQSKRPKERSIHDAVIAVQQLLGQRVDGVVPACTDMDHDRVYGIDQWIVPGILNLLPQAKAKQLLDVLYNQRDQGRATQLMTQLWNAASTLAKYQFCGIDTLLPEPPASEEDA